MDAISRAGKVSLVSSYGTLEVDAIGVEGDFFQFHPLYLLDGTYFSTVNPMKDGIILDKETAWQLFGSSNVSGMEVSIAGVPHIVIGVYEKDKGRLQEAAGLNKPICFLSIESLNNYGGALGGYFYDIVLPNPIKNFGLTTVRQLVAADTANVSVVDNSVRYGIVSLVEIIRNFGIRSMSHENIIYPYWENIARGYEDIFALFLIFKAMLLLVPGIIIFSVFVIWYKNKKWSGRDIINLLKDKCYEIQSKKAMKAALTLSDKTDQEKPQEENADNKKEWEGAVTGRCRPNCYKESDEKGEEA